MIFGRDLHQVCENVTGKQCFGWEQLEKSGGYCVMCSDGAWCCKNIATATRALNEDRKTPMRTLSMISEWHDACMHATKRAVHHWHIGVIEADSFGALIDLHVHANRTITKLNGFLEPSPAKCCMAMSRDNSESHRNDAVVGLQLLQREGQDKLSRVVHAHGFHSLALNACQSTCKQCFKCSASYGNVRASDACKQQNLHHLSPYSAQLVVDGQVCAAPPCH